MSQIEPNLTTDASLLQQVEQGNERAFNLLFEKYWDTAFPDAYKRVKDYDAAKDIVQDIFTHIWINRQTLHIKSLPAYLNRAIRNKVIKYIARENLSYPFFDILDNLPERNSRTDSDLLWKEFFESYEALLESLPPKRQLAFRLHYQQHLSTKDISRQLGITTKTVQNQLGKAMKTLRDPLLRILTIWAITLITLL